MSDIRDRLLKIAEYKGLSIRAFEEQCGLKRGNISNIQPGGAIGSDKLAHIFDTTPEINPIWLITGAGEMLTNTSPGISRELIETDPTIGKNDIPPTAPTEIHSQNTSPQDTSVITSLVATIQKQAEEIGRLKERIAQLEREKNASSESPQSTSMELATSPMTL